MRCFGYKCMSWAGLRLRSQWVTSLLLMRTHPRHLTFFSLPHTKIKDILEHEVFKLKGSCPWVLSVQRKRRNVEAGPEDAGSWNRQRGQHASVDAHPLPTSDPSAAAHSWQKSRIDFDSLSDLKLAFRGRATVLDNLTIGKQELRQLEKNKITSFFPFFYFFLVLNDRVIIPST